MLTRFRARFSRLVTGPAKALLRIGAPPNAITLASIIFASLALAAAYSGFAWFVPMLLALSGYSDAVDGAVARLSGRVSRFGAFLDSFCDRVAEALMVVSLVPLGMDPLIAYTLITTSILVSYARARAEALGLHLEGVGLVERAERIIVLIVLSILYAAGVNPSMQLANLGLADTLSLILALLNSATAIQRVLYVRRALQQP